MKKNEVEVVAAIEIGINFIKMIIAQITPNGEYFVLEELERPSNIKMDMVISNKVSIDAIRNMCSILESYAKLMRQYKVKIYRAVSSGIRTALNREYIIEQIKLFTGINVNVINIGEERFFMCKALNRSSINSSKTYKDGNMILNLSLEGFGITIYKEGTLLVSEFIKIEALQLHEIFFEIVSKNLNSFNLIEEYIYSKIHYLIANIDTIKINNLIILGEELPLIAHICHKDKRFQHIKFIHSSELDDVCLKIKDMCGAQIPEELNIKVNNPVLLIASIIVLNCFVKITGVNKINVPVTSLKNGLLEDIVDDFYNTKRKSASVVDIINSVKYVSRKYGFDMESYEYKKKIALSIFDQLVKIHKLGERERLYLQIASMLFQIGEHMDISDEYRYYLNFINTENMLGLSDREGKIVANIAINQGDENRYRESEGKAALNLEDKMTVAKLTGILKISNSLDLSNKKKVEEIKITQSERKLLFYVKVKEDFLLEQWSFKYSCILLKEVTGYDCILIQRNTQIEK